MSEEIKEEYQKETVFERAVAVQRESQKGEEAFNPNAPESGFLSYDDHKPLKHVQLYAKHKAVKNHDAAFLKVPVDEDDFEDNYKRPKSIPEDKGWQSGRITYQTDRNGKPIEGHLHPIHKAKRDPKAAFEKYPAEENGKSLYETYTERHHKYFWDKESD